MDKIRQRNLAQIFSMFGNEHENHSLVPYLSLIWNEPTTLKPINKSDHLKKCSNFLSSRAPAGFVFDFETT